MKTIMNETPKNNRGWQILRRFLIGVAIFATLIAIFYTEEDWRGKRAWENCKREFETRGETLDWNAYIPPTVPDDQNIFAAPKMQDWFVKNSQATTNEFYGRLRNVDTTATNLNEAAAARFLAWSDQFEPDFDLIREALKRPYARMNGDYSMPYEQPIPNFVNVRILAQTLAQRAKCDLLLGQPDKALQELTLMHDMHRLLEAAPTGKPMTLVAAMVNVAVTGLYVDTIASGLKPHAWQESQLVALQEQLKGISLLPIVAATFKIERVALFDAYATHPAKLADLYKFADVLIYDGASSSDKTKAGAFWWRLTNPMYLFLKLAPRGWSYQNMVNCTEIVSKYTDDSLDGFDLEHDTISPRIFDESTHNLNQFHNHESPFKLLAAIATAQFPNFTKASQLLAYNQTLVNEAQVVCALERYHLAHGEYPETLDALVPQFIEKLPHDLIGGPPSQGSGAASQPLHYRRMDPPSQSFGAASGKFLLYSIGWNETDDGGQDSPQTKNGGMDYAKGDWVWKN